MTNGDGYKEARDPAFGVPAQGERGPDGSWQSLDGTNKIVCAIVVTAFIVAMACLYL